MKTDINYYSTNGKSESVDFRQALGKGLAPDGGLYMPDFIPQLDKKTLEGFRGKTVAEIGKTILEPWFGAFLSKEDFDGLIEDAFNFDAPLKEIESGVFIQELFHGPTFAFKDFAARIMGRLMAKLVRKEGETLHVLTATSGDTGAAVADGFHNVPGIHVWVLYPSGKVSDIQEKQFTTLGGNVTAIEVDGTFDDCQRLVKQAFVDEELNAKMTLTSANSINIGRLLPQMVYYVYAWANLTHSGKDPVFVVPSGNFGNLTAGLIASKMGLPVRRFIAANNSNKTFHDYLEEGDYKPRPSVRTLSNAMDVGDPSNFFRIFELYGRDIHSIKKSIGSYWFDDDETTRAIEEIYDATGYVMDPHTAVGYLGYKSWIDENPVDSEYPVVILATAHPAKFADVMPKAVAKAIELPDRFKAIMQKQKVATELKSGFEGFKKLLLGF